MHHRTESLHSYFASDPPSCGIKINENESVCPMVTPTADPQSPKSLYHWWITQNETGLLWRRNWAMLVWNRLEFIKPVKSTLQKFLAAEEIQAKPLAAGLALQSSDRTQPDSPAIRWLRWENLRLFLFQRRNWPFVNPFVKSLESLEFRESAWAWSTGISVAGCELPGPLSSKAIHERQADGERL